MRLMPASLTRWCAAVSAILLAACATLPDSTPDSIPEQLRSLAWIDLRGGLKDKKGFTKLLSAVTKPHEEDELAQQQGIGDHMMAAGDAYHAAEHYEKALKFARAKGDQRDRNVTSRFRRLPVGKCQK